MFLEMILRSEIMGYFVIERDCRLFLSSNYNLNIIR